MGKALGKGKVKIVLWWTEKCSKESLIRNSAKVKRKVKKTYSFQYVIAFKRSHAVRKVIRSAKRDYCRQFVNGMGERIDISELWGRGNGRGYN